MSPGKYVAAKVALVLLCGHGTARGQAPDSTGLRGRWYAGAGAATNKYFARRPPSSRIRPAYVSAGYCLTPRVALQAQLQYGQQTQHGLTGRSEVDGQVFRFETTERSKITALTVLMRYDLSRPQRRLQVAWVLGVAVVHNRSSNALTTTTPAGTQRRALPATRSTEPHAVGGLSGRYRLGPRWAVGTELVVNRNLLMSPFRSRRLLQGSGANVGVTYSFGPTKP